MSKVEEKVASWCTKNGFSSIQAKLVAEGVTSLEDLILVDDATLKGWGMKPIQIKKFIVSAKKLETFIVLEQKLDELATLLQSKKVTAQEHLSLKTDFVQTHEQNLKGIEQELQAIEKEEADEQKKEKEEREKKEKQEKDRIAAEQKQKQEQEQRERAKQEQQKRTKQEQDRIAAKQQEQARIAQKQQQDWERQAREQEQLAALALEKKENERIAAEALKKKEQERAETSCDHSRVHMCLLCCDGTYSGYHRHAKSVGCCTPEAARCRQQEWDRQIQQNRARSNQQQNNGSFPMYTFY